MTLPDLHLFTPFQLIFFGGSIGAVVASIIVLLLCRSKLRAQFSVFEVEKRAAVERLSDREQQLTSLASKLALVEQEIKAERVNSAELRAHLAVAKTNLDAERRQAREKLQFQEQERKQLKLEFERLAQRIFDEKSDRLSKQNLQNIGTVLDPLREQLGDFKKRVEDVYDKESKERTRLASEILHLKGLNERISQDAINLTNALKGESKTRGNWGEIILERILEDAGLREGLEFDREAQFSQDGGGRGRPDVIIHLPDKHDLIVDSKVSLAAFEEAMSIESEDERAAATKRHVSAMRLHVKQLSEKSYQTLKGVNTLDFVLMFVPIEPALHAAFAQAPEIFQEAYEKNIFIVSPTTLLMACRTVQNIWRTDSQSKNSLEISREAANMLDKFSAFVEDIDEMGKQIDRTYEAYRKARNKLESGKGNLIIRAKKIEKLGAKGKKQLPESEEIID